MMKNCDVFMFSFVKPDLSFKCRGYLPAALSKAMLTSLSASLFNSRGT